MKSPLRVISVITTLITLIINSLAVILPLNNRTTAQISNSFGSYFVPANYVFGIWGIIYLGLIAYSIYQFTKKGREDSTVDKIAPLFILSNIANSVWIFMWQYGHYNLSLVIMIVLLITLILIYSYLNIGSEKVSRIKFWMVNIVFSIYLGWITVATIANVTDTLISDGFNGFGIQPRIWSAILVAVATILTLVIIRIKKDIAYSFVIVWALVGILIKFKDIRMISYTAFIGCIFILGWLLYTIWSENKVKNIKN